MFENDDIFHVPLGGALRPIIRPRDEDLVVDHDKLVMHDAIPGDAFGEPDLEVVSLAARGGAGAAAGAAPPPALLDLVLDLRLELSQLALVHLGHLAVGDDSHSHRRRRPEQVPLQDRLQGGGYGVLESRVGKNGSRAPVACYKELHVLEAGSSIAYKNVDSAVSTIKQTL